MERSGKPVAMRSRRSALQGLAWIGGAAAWTAAAAVGALLTVFFAATVAVIAVMGVAVLLLSGAAARSRVSRKAADDPNLIEARNIGGHSWVAYGWDQRS